MSAAGSIAAFAAALISAAVRSPAVAIEPAAIFSVDKDYAPIASPQRDAASIVTSIAGPHDGATPPATTSRRPVLAPIPRGGQTQIVTRYLGDLVRGRYDDAFGLLTGVARAYYGEAANLRSIYVADAYHLERFHLLGIRTDGTRGSLYYARERARFRDHAHDLDLVVTATVPIGVVPEAGGWRIKDPGHPRRAFATQSVAAANGLRIAVKKISFFEQRIEAVVTFVNESSTHITLLPYGKSILRDNAGNPYRIIETRDWSLTDKVLFEGLRLPPNARYTGTLTFADVTHRESQPFSLTVAPLLGDGADAPFSIEITGIAPLANSESHAK